MHELSIAQSLVELIEDELSRRHMTAETSDGETDDPSMTRPRLGRIVVRVGELSGVVPEALASAFPVAIAHSTLRGGMLSIEPVAVTVFCPACGGERELPSPQRLRCPTCDAPTPQIAAGRELELVSIEVLDEPAQPTVNDSSPKTT